MSMINNALTGSLAAQMALNTTSQNIANVKTTGYTRQGVLLGSVAPAAGVLSAGNGVRGQNLLSISGRRDDSSAFGNHNTGSIAYGYRFTNALP